KMRELLDLALQVLAWRERSMSTMLERLQQLVDGKLPRPPIADRIGFRLTAGHSVIITKVTRAKRYRCGQSIFASVPRVTNQPTPLSRLAQGPESAPSGPGAKNERRSMLRKKIILVILIALLGGPFMAQEAKVTGLMSEELREFPGKEGLMITVEYAPGGSDPVHRHDAHAFVYVLEGSIVMQVRGEKA